MDELTIWVKEGTITGPVSFKSLAEARSFIHLQGTNQTLYNTAVDFLQLKAMAWWRNIIFETDARLGNIIG